jgi:hypothetical protein
MERRISSSLNSLTAFLQVAACIVSVAMLLLFPAAKVHNFGTHFRTPEVRRAIERHTFVAHSENNTHERVAQSVSLPAFFTPAESASKIVARDNFESPSEAPLTRLLKRRKLNSSGSGGQNPLLKA